MDTLLHWALPERLGGESAEESNADDKMSSSSVLGQAGRLFRNTSSGDDDQGKRYAKITPVIAGPKVCETCHSWWLSCQVSVEVKLSDYRPSAGIRHDGLTAHIRGQLENAGLGQFTAKLGAYWNDQAVPTDTTQDSGPEDPPVSVLGASPELEFAMTPAIAPGTGTAVIDLSTDDSDIFSDDNVFSVIANEEPEYRSTAGVDWTAPQNSYRKRTHWDIISVWQAWVREQYNTLQKPSQIDGMDLEWSMGLHEKRPNESLPDVDAMWTSGQKPCWRIYQAGSQESIDHAMAQAAEEMLEEAVFGGSPVTERQGSVKSVHFSDTTGSEAG